MREEGRSDTDLFSLPHAELALTSARGRAGERQEHRRFRRRWAEMFRVLDILTVRRATGDLTEHCRILLDTQLMFS